MGAGLAIAASHSLRPPGHLPKLAPVISQLKREGLWNRGTLVGGQDLFWFRPPVCRGYFGGALVTATRAGSGFDLNELLGRSLANRTWSSRNDLWAESIYFKGRCHLVFAKIVERRPQNSRRGLPRLTAASRA